MEGNNKTINFPLKNNICGFLEATAANPTAAWPHTRAPTIPTLTRPTSDHLHWEMRGRRLSLSGEVAGAGVGGCKRRGNSGDPGWWFCGFYL